MPIPVILAGLLKALAANGLSMIGNAVLAKGKEVVEEKLGVKIPDDPKGLDEAKLTELAKAQMEHQEFLVTAAAEERRDHLADTQDARERDLKLHQAGYINRRANLMAAGTGLLIVIILLIVVFISSMGDFEKSIITLILGRALGYIDQVFNFEFGTTRASKQKDETIEKLSKRNGT